MIGLFGIANAIGIQYLSANSLRDALRRASHELTERKRAEQALVESS
jgi:hypothetical protein